MNAIRHLISAFLLASVAFGATAWGVHVPSGSRFFADGDGSSWFWLADTGWLLPERLDRADAVQYLDSLAANGFNVTQVQVLNGVPSFNAYGRTSHPAAHDYEAIAAAEQGDSLAYWNHLDYIIDRAAERGIYVAMVPVWGGLVKGGKMDAAQAADYGRFLARRYGPRPNIVWVVGGDIPGDVKPEVWTALATAIRGVDGAHLMTFHPRGRTVSTRWWADAPWIDFHTFQSGHRRRGQHRGEAHSPLDYEEDNWHYAVEAQAASPLPVLDSEPSYEGIPQGLHDPAEPLWDDRAVRRYAYWSVMAGSAGHTYGHNAIMQFWTPGTPPAYGCNVAWQDALAAPGFRQMRHLKEAMLAMPGYASRVPAQDVIVGENPADTDLYIAATRSDSCLMAYNFTGRPMVLDLSALRGAQIAVELMDAATGKRTPVATAAPGIITVTPASGRDCLVIATVQSQ